MRALIALAALVPALAFGQVLPFGTRSSVNKNGVSTVGLTAPSLTVPEITVKPTGVAYNFQIKQFDTIMFTPYGGTIASVEIADDSEPVIKTWAHFNGMGYSETYMRANNSKTAHKDELQFAFGESSSGYDPVNGYPTAMLTAPLLWQASIGEPAGTVWSEFRIPVVLGTGGSAVSGSYRNTLTVDLASIAANVCATDQTITVTGAATGAECIVGSPASLPASLVLTCHVTAADTVKLRICNNSTGAVDAPSLTYSVRVFNP